MGLMHISYFLDCWLAHYISFTQKQGLKKLGVNRAFHFIRKLGFLSVTMSPKFPRCLAIANQIGDRRVEKVLEAVFSREKDAYLCDEREYNQRIEELKARIEHRHGIYKELKKHGIDSVFDECLSELKAAEKVDFEGMVN
ncbi:hypothetical protein CTI12_AA041150 [Artemisia annua]|uniref:Uncharacterized protein n=1 Tax=Artemisia annua TaxID=35608 RepID=A0A2U1PAQ1_ARTAN|nr:hypothetical protein CTI12_AA041150 [Artemisia annua]